VFTVACGVTVVAEVFWMLYAVGVAAVLDTRAHTGIVSYEPSELVVTVRAGTPLAEIEAALDAKGQMLPFEPADYRALYGSQGEPTIGAVAACNLSGPRRIQTGAARDALIGVRLVNGEAQAIKSGGRVMKNVTGLDLVKLTCGAHGTLGLLTEVTFKLLPRPQAQATLVLDGLDDARAIAAMGSALSSPFEVSGAAHLPTGHDGSGAQTLLRLERDDVSLAYRAQKLVERLAPFGSVRRIDGEASAALWRDIAQVKPLTKAQLLQVLRDCEKADPEAGHSQADTALVDFINDDEIRRAYERITKWYA
jgi:glycolate oxidase FAD binding subunit